MGVQRSTNGSRSSASGGITITPRVRANAAAYSADVEWDQVEYATDYLVYFTPTNGTRTLWGTVSAPNLSTTISGLDPSPASYLIEVEAQITSPAGTVTISTAAATIHLSASLFQGFSGMLTSADWDTNGGTTPPSTPIPSTGRTLAFMVPNWFRINQTPVDRVSILLGNLTAQAISGMKIAYTLLDDDGYYSNPDVDPNVVTWQRNLNITGDPTTGWAVAGTPDTDVAAGVANSEWDSTGGAVTSHENFAWVDLPFGHQVSAFGLSLRFFIPQFVAGQQYASTWRSPGALQGSLLYNIDKEGWILQGDSSGYQYLHLRWKDGDFVSAIQEDSTSWLMASQGEFAKYDAPFAAGIPMLALRWGTP